MPLTLGAWNVRTLLDRAESHRPERRTAMVGMELARYNIDIAALSETRFAGEGELCEKSSGYTFYWSGRDADERREAGVGFAVRSVLVNKLAGLPKGVNDRLMTMRLPLSSGKKHMTIVSAYAPTMTNPDEVKSQFYEDLNRVIAAVPQSDKLTVLGDFNARVGNDSDTWEGVIGKYGVGNCNSNGLLLLRTCMEHNLLITNTVFCLPTRNRTSWMHPRSKHWHLIDYVLVRKRDRQDVRVTKSMCGAECWTDHRLIVSKLNVRIQPKRRPQGNPTKKKLNVAKLSNHDTKKSLVSTLDERINSLPLDSEDIEANWATLRDTVYNTASEILGPPKRSHKDWFDENCDIITQLLNKKHELHQACLNDPNSESKRNAFASLRSTVQSKLRAIQDEWLSKQADTIQDYANRKDMKNFYSALREVYGPTSSGTSPLLSADGTTLITEKEKILERWAQHFESILNRESEINDDAIKRLPQVQLNSAMDDPPTLLETEKAIHTLSRGKAPGSDSIPAEIYHDGGPTLTGKLHQLFIQMWDHELIPQEFKDASIIHLYKRKGNRQACDNHRGISLLSIAGKILARILLNRLNKHLESGYLPESQCGFRKNRGTIDMIFAARQLQEKCQEQNKGLFSTYVDLTKAFDTVSRDGLWKIMAKFGCPPKFISMVRQFHEGMQARVHDNNAISESFNVTNGVKQGCVLAPTLFSIMFSAMLSDAFKDGDVGIKVNYRMDGKLFNLRRLKARTKVMTEIVKDFLFADDCALNAGSEADMQESIDKLASACKSFGLTISIKKTEVLYQPPPGNAFNEPDIVIDGKRLNVVNKFTYLGSTLSQNVTIDNEVDHRIARASAAFGRLGAKVWNRRGISIETKLKVYKAVVIPTLLYGSESWTVYARHAQKLNHFHTTSLRKILNVRWQDKVPDTEVLRRASSFSIHTILMKCQIRWAGHVVRMSDERIPKRLLYGELQVGKRSKGGQKKRYKDTLKTSLKAFGIDPNNWEMLAQDLANWRVITQKGAKMCEEHRTLAAQEKRRKQRAAMGDIDVCPKL